MITCNFEEIVKLIMMLEEATTSSSDLGMDAKIGSSLQVSSIDSDFVNFYFVPSTLEDLLAFPILSPLGCPSQSLVFLMFSCRRSSQQLGSPSLAALQTHRYFSNDSRTVFIGPCGLD